MKVSYGILTHNEGECVETLISFLVKHKRPEDEIVVVDDFSTETTKDILEAHLAEDHITLYRRALDKDFASQKNYLNSKCTGDYIFQIDADELPTEYMIENLHILLEENPTVELFLVPRVNTVSGLTEDHIKTWGWNVNENGWVNFPDFQTRLYKNHRDIFWKGKVHEKIVYVETYAELPKYEAWSLQHHKDVKRQELQNEFYSNTFI